MPGPLSTEALEAACAVLQRESKEGAGAPASLDTRDVPTLLHALGYNPSAALMKALVDELQGAPGGKACSVPLDKLHKALVKWLAEHRRALLRDDYARLVSAFRALDVAGRGYLEPGELRAALGAGALSAAEVTDLSSMASDDDERVYYEDLASALAADGLELLAAKPS